MTQIITLDYETHGIGRNPVVPAWTPEAVGAAIWVPGHEPTYMAWGHPRENNISKGAALEYIARVFAARQPMLFHNAPFDLAVTDKEMGGRGWHYQDWRLMHDTQYLIFLDDPYSNTLSLKPSADRYLGMPPTEQNELRDWILANIPVANEGDWGAYIALAPGNLVGRYAIGDVVRTSLLYDHLQPKIDARSMGPAYDRERRLMPILYQSTRKGIRVDRDALLRDQARYTKALDQVEDLIRVQLHAPSLDFGKQGQLAEALQGAGYVTQWVLTKTGKKSTSKKNIKINDVEIANLISYRGALNTCVSTFFNPWVELSHEDGRLHTSWNSVRSYEKDSRGTKTGRLSSNGPNFQNVPNEFDFEPPSAIALPALPYMRKYLLPEPGHTWLKRDFSSQEVRILAHFEDGPLLAAYKANPDLDPHQMARELIKEMINVDYPRKSIKITGFSIIYGSGATGLSAQLKQSIQDAAQIKAAYLQAMPGLKGLDKDIKAVGREGRAIVTWGGREYFTEPSKVVEGRMRSFEYKLLNYLIQGSAADQTKQSIIDWDERRGGDSIFLATVHDEINISAPTDEWQWHMSTLKEAMEAERFDCPFKSEGFKGPNWFDIEGCA